jgi:hypothetical protein
VSSGNRQVGNHFSERDHDRVTNGTHEGVTEEETEGATVGEGISSSEEETSTNDSTNGDHGHLFISQTSIWRRKNLHDEI